MTDELLQYYKGLQSDIKSAKDRIFFIKRCLEGLSEGETRWELQISYNKRDRFYHYDINKARVRQMLLEDLRMYQDYLKNLEQLYAEGLDVEK